jgi:hypothetical protein
VGYAILVPLPKAMTAATVSYISNILVNEPVLTNIILQHSHKSTQPPAGDLEANKLTDILCCI